MGVIVMHMIVVRMSLNWFSRCQIGKRRRRFVPCRCRCVCVMVANALRIVIVTAVMVRMLVTVVMTVMMVLTGVVMIRSMRVSVVMIMTVIVTMFVVVMLMVAMIFMRLIGLRRIQSGVLDHGALDALAMTAPARIAVPRAAAAGAVLGFFLGFAMRALIGLDQGLTVGNRNLIVVRMDFTEGQKSVTVSAVFNECGLQRRLYASDLGKVDVAAQLLALGRFEIKFLDAVAADHNDPGFFRVGGVDQHFVGHFGAHGGGGRVGRRTHAARPGDATVHLIRG
jgi:hypothetical protein